jgi:hypothetical protein
MSCKGVFTETVLKTGSANWPQFTVHSRELTNCSIEFPGELLFLFELNVSLFILVFIHIYIRYVIYTKFFVKNNGYSTEYP